MDRSFFQQVENLLGLADDSPLIRPEVTRLMADVEAYRNSNRCFYHFVRGFLAYHFPLHVTVTLDPLTEFIAAESDADLSIPSQYYAGCCSYDRHDYISAKKWLSGIPLPLYADSGQLWKYFKIVELQACCNISMGCHSEAVKDLEVLVDGYMNTAEEEMAIPCEIFETWQRCSGEAKNTEWHASIDSLICRLAKFR